jgi:ketosteroid isomerase-like protein
MSDSEIIARRRAEFLSAFNRQDVAAMARVRADDSIDVPPNRAPVRGLSAIQAFWREGFAQAETRFSLVPEQLEIGSDVAIDRFRWTLEGAPRNGGDSFRDEGTAIWTWRRQKGDWKFALAIWNSDLPQGQTVWTGAGASAPALTADDRVTLRTLIERRWTAAMLARDSATLLAMCADDIVYMPVDHPALRGHAELRAWLEQFPPVKRVRQSFGDLDGNGTLATGRFTFDATIEVSGKNIDVTGQGLCGFRKEPSGQWLIKSVCWNFDRPMPPSA